jgi:hypothetical protein
LQLPHHLKKQTKKNKIGIMVIGVRVITLDFQEAMNGKVIGLETMDYI